MNKDFIDALNTYYSLKNQYEKNLAKEKSKIINKTVINHKRSSENVVDLTITFSESKKIILIIRK